MTDKDESSVQPVEEASGLAAANKPEVPATPDEQTAVVPKRSSSLTVILVVALVLVVAASFARYTSARQDAIEKANKDKVPLMLDYAALQQGWVASRGGKMIVREGSISPEDKARMYKDIAALKKIQALYPKGSKEYNDLNDFTVDFTINNIPAPGSQPAPSTAKPGAAAPAGKK